MILVIKCIRQWLNWNKNIKLNQTSSRIHIQFINTLGFLLKFYTYFACFSFHISYAWIWTEILLNVHICICAHTSYGWTTFTIHNTISMNNNIFKKKEWIVWLWKINLKFAQFISTMHHNLILLLIILYYIVLHIRNIIDTLWIINIFNMIISFFFFYLF